MNNIIMSINIQYTVELQFWSVHPTTIEIISKQLD